MSTRVICKGIRKVDGGYYIIELPWPYIYEPPKGFGEVVCKTFDEALAHLKKANAALEAIEADDDED